MPSVYVVAIYSYVVGIYTYVVGIYTYVLHLSEYRTGKVYEVQRAVGDGRCYEVQRAVGDGRCCTLPVTAHSYELGLRHGPMRHVTYLMGMHNTHTLPT